MMPGNGSRNDGGLMEGIPTPASVACSPGNHWLSGDSCSISNAGQHDYISISSVALRSERVVQVNRV